jgi:hypothetical protein
VKCTLYQHVRSRNCYIRRSFCSFWVSDLFGGRVALLRSCVASFVWFLTFPFIILFYFLASYYRVPIPNTEAPSLAA